MDDFKNDAYYSDKLKRDLTFIASHMKETSPSEFDMDEVLQDSMMFRMIQISENAKKLSEEYKNNRPEIPWRDIYGLRNRIVHQYGGIDMSIVYETLVYDIPEILKQL